MSYLLDTNAVSALRQTRKLESAPVRSWMQGQPARGFFLSVIVVLELDIGVGLMERRDQRQGRVLRRWLDDQILPAFDGRILPVDLSVARRAAQLPVPDRRPDRDALIAATALQHGHTVVTRNVGDFVPTGVPTFNPWSRKN